MNHLRVVALVLAVGISLVIPTVEAQVYGGPGLVWGIDQARGVGGISGGTDLKDLIVHMILILLDFVLLLAVVAIIVAGIYLIVSNGDEAQKDKAKKIVIYALVGIILILLARVIVSFVNNLFG